jgi:peptidoglycan/LPS O-acetylase OafA/YrhL
MAAEAERVPFRQTGASVSLDAARGIAALLVLLDHCHNLFFVSCADALARTAHPKLIYMLYGLTSAGPQAVVIFFVLSGYLISGSVFRSLEQGRWSWKDYLTNRLVRLWLVLLPALVLCAAWDLGRLAWSGDAGSLMERAHANGLTWGLFCGNLFFLQDGWVRTFGSDRVLWSLGAEFWYYILFPVGLLALRRKTAMKSRLLYAVGFVLVAGFAGRWVLGLFPVWLFGTALALVRPPRVGSVVRWVTAVLYAPVVFVLPMVPWPWRYFKMDYALGLLTVLLLWVLLSAGERANESRVYVRAARSLAGPSYSLYLVHYPMLAFLSVVLTGGTPWPVGPKHLGAGVGLGALAVLYGYGVAACTEWHNDGVRHWVQEKFARRRRASESFALR